MTYFPLRALVTRLRKFTFATIAGLFAVSVIPMSATAGHSTISVNGIDLGGSDQEFFEKLIDLDKDDIDEIREEFADARIEILESIKEVEDAREEVKSVPVAGAILKAVFSMTGKVTTESTQSAFRKVRKKLDIAADKLTDPDTNISQEEITETQTAISVIRTGISDVEEAISQLAEAMRA